MFCSIVDDAPGAAGDDEGRLVLSVVGNEENVNPHARVLTKSDSRATCTQAEPFLV